MNLPNFFKVYIVHDDLKTISVRDCLKLTENYAYLRATRSRGTALQIAYCITPKFTSKKYFKTLKEAKKYIKKENQIKINEIRKKIEEMKKSILYFNTQKNNFELKTEFDYDDRCDYQRYL